MDSADVDEALAEFQSHLNLIFARLKTLWRESAARVHPDLQPAGYKLLGHIARGGDVNAHRLAELFEMDKATVSRQLRMLEDLHLIQSRPDEHDGRLRVLTATGEAQQKLAEIRAEGADRMRSVVSEMTPDELQAASKAFRLLAEA